MWPVTRKAIPLFKRSVAVFLVRKPFVSLVTALTQLANLFFDQIFIFGGMGIVAA